MIDGTEDMDLPLCFVCHGTGKLWCRPSQAWPDDGQRPPLEETVFTDEFGVQARAA